MDLTKLISELRSERQHIEEAILALERIAQGGGKRRGRPPKWMVGLKLETGQEPAKRKRAPVTKTRKVESETMQGV